MTRRGQATVELALGSMIIVTVLILGIHFAEVGFLSLKVEEAANFGLWEVTNRPMHDAITPDYTLYTGSIAAAQAETQRRYANFSGLSSAAGGPPKPITQVFTEVVPQGGKLITVTCKPRRVPGLSQAAGGGKMNLANAIPSPNNGDTGMSCSATATLSGIHIPMSYLDRNQNGFFQQPFWRPLQIHVCSSGLSVGGSCAANDYAILLDDWALSGAPESDNCYLLDTPSKANVGAQCQNPGYYRLAHETYQTSVPGNAGAALAQTVSADPGVDEAWFWMSFAGSDSKWGKFTDHQAMEHQGYLDWETTSYTYPNAFAASYGARSECFLGLNTALDPCN